VTLLRAVDPGDETGLRAAIAGEGRVVVATFPGERPMPSLQVAGERRTVSGEVRFVDSGTHAGAFLVPADDGSGGLVLCAIGADAAGVTVEAMEAIDPGRGLAVVSLADAPATIVASGDPIAAALHDAWLTGALLAAADLVGVAGRVLELSRDYAVEREQFGRPIATFQSVKHKLVDMFAELETARSMLAHALRERADDGADWRTAASAAKARCSDAAMFVAREGVQVHGGIGFTWEHEITHHFRRVTTLRNLYGTPGEHRALVAEGMGF